MSTGDVDIDVTEALAALERFVVENDELLALEERIGRFNIFDALGIVRAEIRHSNFLAWLLDPAESHGQGALFLRAVLMDLLRQSPPEARPLSPIQLDGAALRGVRVRREHRNIDILIECDEPRFVIAVENKIDSGEHSGQLHRYCETVNELYGNIPVQFVFLTREGDEPSDDTWTTYTYRDLHVTLRRARQASAASIGDDVLTFLDHYLNLIGSRFMDDPKIDELCQTIYKNHRRAIDLIVERAGSTEIRVVTMARTLIEQDSRLEVLRGGAKSVMFIPKSWRGVLPPIGRHPGCDQLPDAWIDVLVQARNNKLRLRPTVREASDANLRRKIIERLIAKKNPFGFTVRGRAKNIRPTMTRIGNELVYAWEEDELPDEELIREKLAASIDDLLERTSGLSDALRPIVAEWESARGQSA